jgi:hypothetical protein
MALAEKGFIAYARQLLPKQTPYGEVFLDSVELTQF